MSEVTYKVYADANQQASPTIGTDLISSSSLNMPDDDWYSFPIISNDDPSAYNADEDAYIYYLEASFDNPGAGNTNRFKLRANGGFSQTYQNTIGVDGISQEIIDLATNPPSQLSSSYNGEINYQIELEDNQIHCAIDIYDGDFDRGNDSDDANTPNLSDLPFDPSTANIEAAYSGLPYDDHPSATFRHEPDVTYFVAGPKYTFSNNNPSGNKEWELYRIASEAQGCPDVNDPNYDPDGGTPGDGSAPSGVPDETVPQLAPGTHNVAIKGLDNFNTIWLHASQSIGTAKPRQHCAGQMTWLVLEYDSSITGVNDADIKITQKVQGQTLTLFDTTDPNANEFIDSDGDGYVDDGELLTIAGQKDSGTFGSNIDITITDSVSGVVTTEEITTTCANYSGAVLGLPIGSFIIRDGASLNGGLLL